MRLATVAAGFSLAAVLAMAGAPAAHAQSQNNQNHNKTKQPVMVTVNEGDTLIDIANVHQTTYVRVFDANDKISDPNLIYPGDQFRIPDPNEQLPDRDI